MKSYRSSATARSHSWLVLMKMAAGAEWPMAMTCRTIAWQLAIASELSGRRESDFRADQRDAGKVMKQNGVACRGA